MMLGTAAVTVAFAAFGPPQTTVLAGDTVTWTNQAVRMHAVDGVNESFDSPALVLGESFSHRFDTPGVVQYYCRLHPFMRGEVDVYPALLDPPPVAASPGRRFTLSGRASLPAGSPITIEADDGTGYKPVGSATVGMDGTFAASVMPSATATYRVAGDSSNAVQLQVLNRHVAAAAARHGRRIAVSATVAPAAPGATAVLQLRLKERFGWWPVATAKLDKDSRVRFELRRRRGAVARVVLTLPDGATALAVSPTLRVRALS
jgi:hypothetical protein